MGMGQMQLWKPTDTRTPTMRTAGSSNFESMNGCVLGWRRFQAEQN